MTDDRSSRLQGEPLIIELLPVIVFVIVGSALGTWPAVGQGWADNDWGDLFSPTLVAAAVTLVIVGALRLIYTVFTAGR